ncbi:MAG: hypothetical protein ACRCVJ_01420 [Clostridium sp.]|uniref:hypothetical protein n=1 Tax=Clostridium sp. TaxID=1506 RepID=UPI003F2D83F7
MQLNNEIIIYKENYRYLDKNDLKDIKKDIIKRKFGNFLILEEEIYITEVDFIRYKEIEEYIEKEIKKEFNTSDYLFHYVVYKKEKKGVIYAIKGGNKINHLLKFIKKIKVTPIQFKLIKLIRKKIKNDTFNALIDVEGKFYYLEVVCGILRHNRIIEDKTQFESENKQFIEGILTYPFTKKELVLIKGAKSE